MSYEDYIESIKEMEKQLDNLNNLRLKSLDANKTTLVVIDMVNGFAKEGLLSSDRVKNIIPNIAKLTDSCNDKGIKTTAIRDQHTESSNEVKRLGKHCIKNSGEEELVDELKGKFDKVLPKDTINSALNEKIIIKLLTTIYKSDLIFAENIIVVGCMTDICIYNFVATLRAMLDRFGDDINIYIPINYVETYDFSYHNADLFNTIFLTALKDYGIKLVKEIEA